MNVLLLFFALPVATVILAIVLQKILNNPLLVAATFFAIYLIVTFAAFDASFLVYAILYTILAYITAVLTRLICRLLRVITNHTRCTYRITERPINVNNSTLLSESDNNITNENTVITEINDNNSNTVSDTTSTANGCCRCRR